jgi:hypothetical protein
LCTNSAIKETEIEGNDGSMIPHPSGAAKFTSDKVEVEHAWSDLLESTKELRSTLSTGHDDASAHVSSEADLQDECHTSAGVERAKTDKLSAFESDLLQREKSSMARSEEEKGENDNAIDSDGKLSKFKNYLRQRKKSAAAAGTVDKAKTSMTPEDTEKPMEPDLASLVQEAWSEVVELTVDCRKLLQDGINTSIACASGTSKDAEEKCFD